jgi:uncharacterized damage-inducible protein DinB
MSDQKFAAWVEPMARQLSQSKDEIGRIVKEIPQEAWGKPSAYPGWSFKDHLSHLPHAHSGVHGVLGAVVEGREPDFSRFARIDDLNEENRQEHIETPVADLLAAFLRESEGTQTALARLKAEHAEARFGPMTIGQALQGFALHDMEHLTQMKKALRT